MIILGLQEVESDALRRLWADARQTPQLVDELLNDTLIHALFAVLVGHWLGTEHLTQQGFAVALVFIAGKLGFRRCF